MSLELVASASMKRAISTTLLCIFVICSCSFGQEPAQIDTAARHNIGPNEARGTVEPVKRHVAFHQYLWKIVEYPTKAAVRVASLPLMGLGYVSNKDSTVGNFTEIFYKDNRKGYLFPTLSVQSDRCVAAALQYNHQSLLPFKTGLNLKLYYGGRTEREYRVRISNESFLHRAVRFSLSVYDLRHPDRYLYGVGMQSNEINRTRYPQRDRIVYGKWDISAFGDWAVDVTASYRHTEAIEDKRIGDDCCNSEERWGVGAGVMYDDRAFGEFSPYGWKVVGSVARVFGSRETDSDYWKYDGSIKKHFNVYRRTRIFHLSVRADGVRRINNKSVPFWDLPILGGEDYLRGFPVDRFRDNVTLVFTAQYRYPIFQRLSGSFFVDFGSAAPEWESFKLQDFRTGYGWQLESHLDDNFIFRLQLAHSREGLQVYVATATSIDLLEKKAVR